MNEPKVVCYCFNVKDDFIKDIIRKHGCECYKDIQKHCPVGTRCGACIGDLQDLCEKEKDGS